MKYLMEQSFQLQEVSQTEYKSKHVQLQNEHHIRKLYRGMSIEYLHKHFNILHADNLADNLLDVLYEIATNIFHIGIKSNHYLHNKNPKSVTQEAFSQLAYELQQIGCRNPGYSNLLEMKFNFPDSITEEEKIIIRDYYLTLLHQLGIEEVEPDLINASNLVSTATELDAARRWINHKSNNGIIVEYIIPSENLEHSGISFDSRNNNINFHRILTQYGLPIIDSAPHPSELEISNRYALLPMYISGFYFIEKGKSEFTYFVLNSFFDNKQTPFKGFNVNQEHFDEQIKNTKYQRGVEYRDGSFTDLLLE